MVTLEDLGTFSFTDETHRMTFLRSLPLNSISFTFPSEVGARLEKVVVGDEHDCYGEHYKDQVLVFNYAPNRNNPEVLTDQVLGLLDSVNSDVLVLDLDWRYAIMTQRCDDSCSGIRLFLAALDERLEKERRTLRIVPTGGYLDVLCKVETEQALEVLLSD